MKYKGPRYFLCVNFLLPFLCDSSPQAEKNILQKNHKGEQGYQGDGIFLTRPSDEFLRQNQNKDVK